MPSVRQKKLAQAIVENLKAKKPKNKTQLVEGSGYTLVQAVKKSREIMESLGVRAELSKLGFHEDGAKKVVEEIMYNSHDDMARLKATDQVFKVQGTYAPEKQAIVHAFVIPEEDKTKIDDILNDNE